MDQLSTYELLDLLATYGDSAGEHFMNFVTMFSAYVVAGYLMVRRFSRAALIFVTVLYTFAISLPALWSYTILLALSDIVDELAVRQAFLR